jgi:heat-inducible transcriptional repressor
VKKVELLDREEKTLRSIIECHVKTARPVSSGAVVRHGPVSLSSATVRNVMRLLEEHGLIYQPHTSAGRVPTDAGYRYYVDHLMEPASLSERERLQIDEGVSRLWGSDLGTLVSGVSRLMSEFSKELAVTVAPATEAQIIEQVKLVSLEGRRVLAVATTRAGMTRSAVVSTTRWLGPDDLSTATALVTGWVSGESVGRAQAALREHLAELPVPVKSLVARLLAESSPIFHPRGGERIHYEGTRFILRHPEFSADASFLGEIFDNEDELANLVRTRAGVSGVTVTIGRENRRKEMKKMSLVVGSYRVGASLGQMGVIGPTRMKYSKLIGLVDYCSEALGELLAERGA